MQRQAFLLSINAPKQKKSGITALLETFKESFYHGQSN